MSTGNSGRTNFTLSGREDLGGGMYAFFALNHRFNMRPRARSNLATPIDRPLLLPELGGFGRRFR